MSVELYMVYCSKCRKKNPHRVYIASMTKGLKIRCCICGYIKPRYHNAKTLQKINVSLKENGC